MSSGSHFSISKLKSWSRP